MKVYIVYIPSSEQYYFGEGNNEVFSSRKAAQDWIWNEEAHGASNHYVVNEFQVIGDNNG